MSRRQGVVIVVAGAVLVVGLGAAAVLAGRDGLEVATWVAGLVSLAVAVLTLYAT